MAGARTAGARRGARGAGDGPRSAPLQRVVIRAAITRCPPAPRSSSATARRSAWSSGVAKERRRGAAGVGSSAGGRGTTVCRAGGGDAPAAGAAALGDVSRARPRRPARRAAQRRCDPRVDNRGGQIFAGCRSRGAPGHVSATIPRPTSIPACETLGRRPAPPRHGGGASRRAARPRRHVIHAPVARPARTMSAHRARQLAAASTPHRSLEEPAVRRPEREPTPGLRGRDRRDRRRYRADHHRRPEVRSAFRPQTVTR